LKPTHWTKIVKQTAEQLSLPESEVKVLVLWYWKYYRKEMAKLERTKLEMPGLGTFYLKHWRLEKRLLSLRKRIKATQNHGGSVKKQAVCNKYREEFNRVEAIYNVFQQEHKKKADIRKKQNEMREEHYPEYLKQLKEKGTVDEKIIKYLEEQMENSRRDSVHLVSEQLCGDDSRKED